ncbi:MAG: hypothetical protein II863_02770 [Kiritimatiellae bacterium]|nr:hypothetical protein [Kiritimatiellia bacterium]
MKKLMITLGAVAAAAVTFTAQAEETPAKTETAKPEAAEAETTEAEKDESPLFEVALQLDVNSAYVSHNRIFSDTPVAQYDLWMQLNLPENFGWLAVDVWANQELNKRHSSRSRGNGGKQFGGIGEFDYEIVYGNSIGPVNLTASHLWYTYPRCGWGSQKFWTVGAEYDNEFVVPSIKFFWEYAHDNKPDEAFMIDFALSKGFELTEQLSLKLTSKTTLYTSEYAKYISDGALTDTVFGGWDNGISLSYALTDNISLGAHLNYLYKLDHRVRHCGGTDWDAYTVDSRHGTHDGILYGGVSASLAF